MRNIVCILLIIAICSCKETAIRGNDLYFENPQPLNVSELVTVPNRFVGLYKNEDSTFLKIDKDMITKYVFWKFRIHKTELDSLKEEFDLIGGKWIYKNSNDMFEMRKVEDSLELWAKNTDTIFRFSEFQKAKSYKRDLILNFKDEKYWRINMLTLKKEQLDFKYLSIDNLPFLDSITVHKSVMIDSNTCIIKPSKKEFGKIVRSKIGAGILYKKID